MPDIHTQAAMELFGVSESKVTPEMRKFGKNSNYMKLYGGGMVKIISPPPPFTLTKNSIVIACRSMGYEARYLGKDRLWDIRRMRPSGNTKAFDRIVFANMTRNLGIDHQLKGGVFQ